MAWCFALVSTVALAAGCGEGPFPPSCRQVCEAKVAAQPSASVETCLPLCVARIVRMRADAGSVWLSCLLQSFPSPPQGATVAEHCTAAATSAVNPAPDLAVQWGTECANRHGVCSQSFAAGYCNLAPTLLDATLARAGQCLQMDCPQIQDCLRDSIGDLSAP